MKSIIHKYKSLCRRLSKLNTVKSHLLIDLEIATKSRKNLKKNLSTIHTMKYTGEKDVDASEIPSIINNYTERIATIISKIRECKKNIKVVASKMSNLK